MKSLIIEYQYFAPISTYLSLYNSSHIHFEAYEHFQKMSFRNRCQVLGGNGVINLSVPLVGGRDQKGFTSSIAIDNSAAWQTNHWRTLVSCYNNSPFFLFYSDSLEDFFSRRFERLTELDLAAFEWVAAKLKLKMPVTRTASYEPVYDPATHADLRNRFKPANRQAVQTPPYIQVFNTPYQPNLSILDLLFCMGPQTADYLQNGAAILPF